eukprot:m.88060 g.88060  ORF g.88060 m.88060 type:complete len:818 (-) comp19962_c0_seq7:1953-4406(-)
MSNRGETESANPRNELAPPSGIGMGTVWTSAIAVGVATIGAAGWSLGQVCAMNPGPLSGFLVSAACVVGVCLGVLYISQRWRSADGAPFLHVVLTTQSIPEFALVGVTKFVGSVGGYAALREPTSGGLTPLHVAASENLADVCTTLIAAGASVSAVDGRGLTPLIYAVNSKITQTRAVSPATPQSAPHSAVTVLLANGALPSAADPKGRSALYHAGRLGRVEVMSQLINAARVAVPLVNQTDHQGYTAVHAAVLGPSSSEAAAACVEVLLHSGGNPNVATLDGSTPLHLCARRAAGGGGATTSVLLNNGASWIDPCCFATAGVAPVAGISVNTFGSTVLHVAAGACGAPGAVEVVRALLARRTSPTDLVDLLTAQDNDGLSALHFACGAPNGDAADHSVEIATALLDAGADVNAVDYSDATPLIVVAYRPPSISQWDCAKTLLSAGADVTCENEFGWSALHVAASTANDTLLTLLTARTPADYLATFDPSKLRDMTRKVYVRRCGAHNRIPLNLRRAVLGGDHTATGIAGWLTRRLAASPDRPRIVALVGAGISTNAGIPDFRSPVTGLYSDEKFRTAFDSESFRQDPTVLWTLARDVFGGVQDGTITPTPSHHFLRLLYDRGLLARVYTQNVDGLEVVAGVPAELVVEAHGSMQSAYCEQCGDAADMAEIWRDLRAQDEIETTPLCRRCGPKSVEPYRPAITFFGERLPSQFEEHRRTDLANADLVIVMGTSLVVYPFAGLVNEVGPLVPRLLLNNKLTGPFQLLGDAAGAFGDTAPYRDAVWTGDCDEGAQQLCDALGWRAELDALVAVPSALLS